ncbi:AAA family ATPase [Pseudophaeobacter sp.]|uniref:AAA family ATPase n=1 Tax=Pseudophaeobacter sp. TaxID=1971739 RepID=UPI003297E788
MKTASTVAFSNFYRSLKSPENRIVRDQISNLQKTFRALQVLDFTNENLTNFFREVGYIEPVRTGGERYYRKQELEVSEILPNGSNFPMFLDSLTPSLRRAFSNWVEEIFGYGVELSPSAGHISINLTAGENSVNVKDTGYGVSQILPVLASVWWAGRRPSSRWLSPLDRMQTARTLAIEQPELHLHPAHQAKLADVFVRGIKKDDNRPPTNFIIETHSESLINRLGELVEDGELDKDDVQVVIFSALDDINSPTEISLAKFNERGALSNWPFGFFNYTNS